MFDITSNQVIKIHKGDDSGSFPLFINQGTNLKPLPYKFYSAISISQKPKTLDIKIDNEIFNQKVVSDGFYDFEYNFLYDDSGKVIGELGWYLNKELINLEEYGLHILKGSPKEFDHIKVARFVDHTSEVYFYILEQNADLNHALVKKTFITNGEILTEFADPRISTLMDTVDDLIDEKHKMKLRFSAEDTMCLFSGEYCYQIRAKLYDINTDAYILNTITSRLPFIIIDGDESCIW